MHDVDDWTKVPPPSLGPGRGHRVEHEVIIHALPRELYRMWRDLSLIGRIFRHVDRVECSGPDRSHWVVPGPLGTTVEWDAEIINDVENELIGWQSLPGSDVDCAGSVHFDPCGADATTLRVVLRYDPPGGAIGAAVAMLFRVDPKTTIPEDLARFKDQVENGQVPTKDPVETASEDSFPASDPPSNRKVSLPLPPSRIEIPDHWPTFPSNAPELAPLITKNSPKLSP